MSRASEKDKQQVVFVELHKQRYLFLLDLSCLFGIFQEEFPVKDVQKKGMIAELRGDIIARKKQLILDEKIRRACSLQLEQGKQIHH